MEPNLVFYQVLKPTAMVAADGSPQFAMVGMSQDFNQALGLMMQTPGGIVTVMVVLAKNPNSLATPGLTVPKQ